LHNLLIGCKSRIITTDDDAKIVVTDFRGEQLRFSTPPERVVCLIESALSGIYMLRMEQILAGIPGDIYSTGVFRYYARLDSRISDKKLVAPGNWDFVSIEQVVGLRPDLVIIWKSQAEVIQNLEKFGIPVYAVMMHSFEDVYKEIQDFGVMFNCRERADSLVTITKANLEGFRKLSDGYPQKNAYFMWSQGINETSGINSTVNDLFRYAGVGNVCTLDQEHVSINVETLHDWDPDLIVMWYNEKLDPRDILENPQLKGLRAVRDSQVYELPEVFGCDFWTLKMQCAVHLVAEWAYRRADTTASPAAATDIYKFLYGQNSIAHE